MEQLLFLGFPAVVALLLTILFCRHRVAHGKSVAFGTLSVAVLGATAFTLVCALGFDAFSPRYWIYTFRDRNVPPIAVCVSLGVLLAVCVVPAAFVVGYYRSRSRK
jgi:hypothetical protein